MPAGAQVVAWRPAVPGIVEVLHARFTDHAYPMHTHDAWTLLLVDDGAVRYDLGRHEHAAISPLVTLLPPHVPHNGCDASSHGFRKRVVYLEAGLLGEGLVGRSVDHPTIADPPLRAALDRLHRSLVGRGDELDAEARLAVIADRLRGRLAAVGRAGGGAGSAAPRGRGPAPPDRVGPPQARALRELLDAHVVTGLTLRQAAADLDSSPSQLVRAFGREFATSPHQYLVGRRVDLARRLLLAGMPVAEVATAAGFYDQPHLTRTFTRVLGVTPARYARSGPVRG